MTEKEYLTGLKELERAERDLEEIHEFTKRSIMRAEQMFDDVLFKPVKISTTQIGNDTYVKII